MALLVAAIDARLCAPVSGMGDSSELTMVLATGGLAHPTGYPLYTLFGHAFCAMAHALGIGWPLAASWWSVVGAAVAFFFLASLAIEWAAEIPRAGAARWWAPILPLLLLALSPVVVGESTRAEVNVWSLAWGSAASSVFVRLARGLEAAPSRRSLRRSAAAWGIVCGLGLAHHLTSVLVSLPLSGGLLVLLARRRALGPELLAIATGAALMPLAADLYVVWRAWHPAVVQWPLLEPSVAGVVGHLTGHQYRGFLGSFTPSGLQAELILRVVVPFLAPGLILLALGLGRARGAGERVEWAALLGAALATTGFALRYGVDDPAPYFLVPMALGTAAAAPAIASIPGIGSRGGFAVLGAGALASLLVIAPWIREAREQREAAIAFDQTIHAMWSSIPPDTAIVSWTDDRFNRLREYQVLRGEKPALLVVTPDLLLGGRIREEIVRRFGADPKQGFGPLGARASDPRALAEARRELVRRLNERVRVPVILFDPTVPIVWQYRKPWEPRGP